MLRSIRRRSRDRRRGISLLELTMVAGIIAALAAIAIPRYARGVERAAIEAAARRCAAEFEAVRCRAVAERRALALRLTPGETRIDIVAVDGDPIDGPTSLDLGGSPYNVTISATTFAGSVLTFDQRGLAVGAGTVVLARGPHRRTLRVNAAGGVAWR